MLRVDDPATPGGFRDVTENLSAGGLLVRTDRELPVGGRVPLRLGFPGLLDPLEIEVEVVWCRPPGATGPAAVAVQIPADRADDRRRLAALVEAARAAAGPEHRTYRVLVVEDNPHVVEMYEYALRKLGAGDGGVKVEYAPHGHLALVRLGQQPPIDLVMADLYMPVMDGFTLIERMRGDARLKRIPILVVSAGAADARSRALDLGADVYLQKPVQFGDVIATVRTLLRIPS